MLILDLPFEVISIIANLLTTKDKLHCVLVCKAWRQPFQSSLWNTVEITSQNKLKSICNSLCRPSVYKLHGGCVQQLNFSGECRTTNDQLFKIQKYFRNLQRLYIGRFCLESFSLGTTVDWSLWECLTELKIDLYRTRIICEQERQKLFSCLPSLRRLTITQSKNDTPFLFSLDNFEDLHCSLSKLEHLSLNIDLKSLTSKDQVRLWLVTPTKSITTINFCTRGMTTKWLCYFARKYPNITNLGLETTDNHGMPDLDQEDALRTFSGLPAAFSQLKRAMISTNGAPETSHMVLWDLLSLFTIPLKHIAYKFDSVPHTPELVLRIIQKCMRLCPNTIETLSLECGFCPYRPQPVATVFELCPRLVDLYIDIFHGIIMVDVILDNCKALKRFKVSKGSLELAQDKPKDPIMHGLRIIEITGATVLTTIFKYISFHCRKLNYTSLAMVKVIGDISETGSVSIDMPYTQFKILQLFYVQCYTSYDTMCEAIGMNLMVLSKPKSSLEHSRHQGPFISLAQDLESNSQMWIHTFYEKSKIHGWAPNSRALMKKEVKFARKYYRNFQDNKNTSSTRNVERSWTGEVAWHNWKEDLCRGYFVFNCGDIDEYYIHQEKAYDPRLFNGILSTLD
ncbi:hypothetical protein CLU79DRAFT_839680 [Phycomyces nitens]|nr:hypothetical protein CLU79DRAFT_839680 [Phycomyces nitens]